MRTHAALALLAATAACVPLPGNRQLSRKTVAGKEGEATLVADDGARCRVDGRTFARAEVGKDATCVWQYQEGNPPPQRVPIPGAGPRGG